MLTIPPPQFRRYRKPLKNFPAAPPVLLPLTIVSVHDIAGGGPWMEFVLTLDVNDGFELADLADADPAQWWSRLGNRRFNGSELDVYSPTDLYVYLVTAGSNTGPNVCNYAASPRDIFDTEGRSLGAVVNYPI